MRDKPNLKPCPVCGKMVTNEGNMMHIRSKFHQDALKAQKAKDNPVTEPVQQEPKTQKLIKPVPLIDPLKQKVKDEQNSNTEKDNEWKGFFAD